MMDGNKKIKIAKNRVHHPIQDFEKTEILLKILRKGSIIWNQWRENNANEYIDFRGVSFYQQGISFKDLNLSEANLEGANLARIDFDNTNLTAIYACGANFQVSNFKNVNFQGSNLSECDFSGAKFFKTDFRLTNLSNTNLFMIECFSSNFRKSKIDNTQIINGDFKESILAEVDLSDSIIKDSDFSNVDLTSSLLEGTSFINVNFEDSDFSDSIVYGTSVWKVKFNKTKQNNLIITPASESIVTVDNINVAQFIYLMLNDNEIREVIDTITSKVVLIIGRFSPSQKIILDTIRQELRKWNYTPIMFDFSRPTSRNFIETVKTLAGMSKFVIADITDSKVVLQELDVIVKGYPSLPIQPLILQGNEPSAVILDFMDYQTFMPIFQYTNLEELIELMNEKIILPAENKISEILERRKRAEKELFNT